MIWLWLAPILWVLILLAISELKARRRRDPCAPREAGEPGRTVLPQGGRPAASTMVWPPSGPEVLVYDLTQQARERA